MATFLTFTPEQWAKLLRELTSLEKALEVTDQAKWLEFKKSYLWIQFNHEKEKKIFDEYRRLMYKAVERNFESGDYEDLNKYRTVDSTMWDEALETINGVTGQIHIPAPILRRDEDGKIIEIDLSYFDAEINVALFTHIFDILVGRSDVRMCEAEDCDKLFIPKRKNQKYHSNLCRQRQYDRRQTKNPS